MVSIITCHAWSPRPLTLHTTDDMDADEDDEEDNDADAVEEDDSTELAQM